MKVLFDTMVHVTCFEDRVPNKWKRAWDQIRFGHYKLLLTEPLISEMFYILERKHGGDNATTYILQLKGFKSTKILPNDRHAFLSAHLRHKYRRYDLSLVDSFSLALAKIEKAQIYTTDHGLRDAAKAERCNVSFLPLEEVFKQKG